VGEGDDGGGPARSGDEVPVGGMADSIVIEDDETWARTATCGSPPTAEGAIRLGISSRVG